MDGTEYADTPDLVWLVRNRERARAQAMEAVLSPLTPREADVVYRRSSGQSARAIGLEYGVSPDRIRTIEKAGKRRLMVRHARAELFRLGKDVPNVLVWARDNLPELV